MAAIHHVQQFTIQKHSLMTGLILAIILATHYVGDFLLQTDAQAKGKSSSNKMLVGHISTYSLIWWLVVWALTGSAFMAFQFWGITFIAHFATDYITSRIVKKQFERQDTHGAFAVIGFDQILHYVQLYFTFKFLIYGDVL